MVFNQFNSVQLERAITIHKQGDLESAEKQYCKILKKQPDNPIVNHYLGYLYYQTEQNEKAEIAFKESLKNNPNSIETHNNLCLVLRRGGKLKDAVTHAKTALKINPGYAPAHNNLALLYNDIRRFAEAEKHCKQAIKFDPGYIDAYHNLGIAQKNLAQFDEALHTFNAALQSQPGHIKIICEIAEILNLQGNYIQAIKICKKIIELNPDNARADLIAATGYEGLGNIDGAIQSNHSAIKKEPDNIYAFNSIGLLFKQKGQYEQALNYFDRALRVFPDFTTVLNNKGVVLRDIGQHIEAKKEFEKILIIDPDYAKAHFNMGTIYSDAGNKPEAIKYFRKAIKLEPNYSKAYRLLSFLNKHTEVNNDIKTMERLSSTPDLPDSDITNYNFALGKAYQDLADHQQAYTKFELANKTHRKTFKYSITKEISQFNKIKSVFNHSFFDKYKNIGSVSDKPVFVLGMPRSGTSLVEQILSSHSNVYGAGELVELHLLCQQMSNVAFPEEYDNLEHSEIIRAADKYIDKITSLSANNYYCIDKLPHNFLYIGLIFVMFPNARIIHCKRNPMDTCLSIFTNYFETFHPYSCDLEELGQYYLRYEDLMKYWEEIQPGIIYHIGYENLVQNGEDEINRLLEFCNLEFEQDCLNFYKNKRTVKTLSNTQVRQPLYTSSVGRWKQYETNLKPLVNILGTN